MNSDLQIIGGSKASMETLPVLCSTDVAHYYMGCMFKFTYHNNGEVIYAKNTMLNDTMFSCGEIEWFEIDGKLRKPIKDKYDWYDIENIKTDGKFELILSSTWDLTTKQNREYLNLCFKIFDLKNDKSVCRYADTPLSMRYLFINHIDAFDLIGNNQAIDKKKVLHLFS